MIGGTQMKKDFNANSSPRLLSDIFEEGPLLKKLQSENIVLEELLKEVPREVLRRQVAEPETFSSLITSLFLLNESLSAILGGVVKDFRASPEENSGFMAILNKGYSEDKDYGYLSAARGERLLLTSLNLVTGKPLLTRAYEAAARAVVEILERSSELQDLKIGKMTGEGLSRITGIESDLFWKSFIELYNCGRLVLDRQKEIEDFVDKNKKRLSATAHEMSQEFGIPSIAFCTAFIENIAVKGNFEDSVYEAIFRVLSTRIPVNSGEGEFAEIRRITNITITSFDEPYLEIKRQLDEKLGDTFYKKSSREQIEDNVRTFVIANIFKSAGSKTFWKDTWNFLLERDSYIEPWNIFDSVHRGRLIKKYKQGEKFFKRMNLGK